MEIRVPDLAEGVESGTVVNILVKEGDQVKKNQDVVELETKKAVAGIPSTVEGTVTKILVKPGDEVNVGQALLAIAENGAGKTTAVQTSAPTPRAAQPAPMPVQISTASTDYVYQSTAGVPPPASPSLRKMANELGIDLARVRGSERGGRIVLEDVRNYILQLQQGVVPQRSSAPSAAPAPSKPAPASVDFSKWGPVSKKKMTPLRRAIADQMVSSWTTIPHVTQYDEADITDLLALRKKEAPEYEKKGAKLTLTCYIIKVVADLLKKNPVFNCSLDEATHEIVTKEYVHIGIAVDTEAGLMVPVLRNADKKSLAELAKDLVELAEKTRARKISLEEMQGGTFTISNQGGIGGTHFTPIINKPEVAILGLGQGVVKPVVRGGKIEPRTMLPICLSYDHRVIDGGSAARFIKELSESLANFKS